MGNTPSEIKKSPKQNKPVKPCIKKPPTSINSNKKNIIKSNNNAINNIDNGEDDITSNVPYYHLKHKTDINNGLKDYQYFKHVIPPQDVTNKFGVDTTIDNKYSRNVSSLYDKEVNYRQSVDCSKEIPYTQSELENELGLNIKTHRNTQEYSSIPNTNYSNENNISGSSNTNSSGITITREEAIIIRNCKYLSQLEKRIMIMNNIKYNELDPLNILVEHRLRLINLIDKYKSLLRIYHPDKTGGVSNDMFINIKEALDKQLYVNKSKIMDKDFNQLKHGYDEYSENSKKKKPLFVKDDIKEIDQKKFNKLYDEHKYTDEYEDDGYGDIMVKGGVREDIEIEKINITDTNTFDDQFNKKLEKSCNQIIPYQVPEAINQYDNYAELCNKRSGYTGKNSNIDCFDYKEAFEIQNIDRNKKINNKTIDEYQNERESDSLEMTEEQKYKIEQKDTENDEHESQRQARLVDYSNDIEVYHSKLNKVLLKN
jgi:hypothetical protein